jgi:hypothetical protein
MTVSADGRDVFVYDGASGRVADVDTTRLAVRRTANTKTVTTSSAAAAMRSDGAVIIAAARHVIVLDPGTLKQRGRWISSENIVDLSVPRGSGDLFEASKDAVTIVDAQTGATRRRLAIAGADTISYVGPSWTPLNNDARQGFQCAC